MFRSLILCGCLAFATTGIVGQETQEAPRPTAKHDFKTAGRNVGHGSKHGAKDVGHGFKHDEKKD